MKSIQDNLSQDISYAVDDILGKDGFELEKLELLSSLLYLFRRQANEIKTKTITNENQYNNTLSPFNTPYNNTSFFNPSMSYNPFQNFNYPQSSITPISPMTPITPISSISPITSMGPFNPYNFNNSQPQLPFQYPLQLQPQSLQQPNFIYPGFPLVNEPNQQQFKTKPKKSSHKKKGKSSKSHKKQTKSSKSKSKHSKSEDSDSKTKTFKYDGTQTFHGILNYLTQKTGGNIDDNGTISITSNSTNFSKKDVRNLVNYEKEQFFSTGKNELVSICFDFKDKLIQPDSYSIKSCSYPPFETHGPSPRNWVIEVSNDKSNWEIIDEHKEDQTFNKCLTIFTFNVQKKSTKYYRYFQFRQTGNSWDSNGQSKMLILRQFELYGKLKMP